MGKNVKGIDGLPVMDAKSPVKIIITASDVAKADPKRPEGCAAARAIVRDCHAVEARVHLGRVYIRRNNSNWTRYQTPAALRSEIIAFDRGGAFQPGEYRLTPIAPSEVKARGKRRGGPTPPKKKISGTRPRHIIKNVRTGPA